MAGTENKKIHVLHVLPMLGTGGIELALARVVNGLPADQFKHTVCCLKGAATIAEKFPEDTDIICMNTGSNELKLPFRLRSLIKKIRPTVIHARNWGAWPDVSVGRLLTIPRVPLIFSFHGLDSRHVLPWRRRIAFRWLSRMTTKLFTVTDASKQQLVDMGLRADRIDVIPNGVDTRRFSPQPHRQIHKRLVIGTVGHLSPVKDIPLLIKSAAEAIKCGVDLEVRVAGEGSEKAKINQLIGQLEMTDRVTLVGHVEDVPGFLNELDIFILSSESEQHPNALMEAMACGLPCVATRVGGVPWVLQDGKFGVLVDWGDVKGMADAIGQLVGNPDQRNRLGQLGREHVCDKFSMQQMLKDYSELYESVSL